MVWLREAILIDQEYDHAYVAIMVTVRCLGHMGLGDLDTYIVVVT